MKILLLTQYFPPEFGACAARNSEHAALWAEAGHDVEVCTAFPNYPSGVVPEAYRGRWFAREERGGYRVFRSWSYATPNRAVWRRALASFSFFCSALLCGAFKCQRPDVVIASSGPFFMGPLGYLVSVLKRAVFVFEVRDILPQQAVDAGMLENRFLIGALTAVEQFLYRRARGVVCVAEASRQALVERGVDESKSFTVENGICEDFFIPGPKENAIRAEYGWSGRFVVMYIGAHGVSQGLHTLLDAAKRLENDEDMRFVLIGDGSDKPGLVEDAERRGLRNVEFLPIQDKARMPLFYVAADVCLAPLRAGGYFRVNIPSKIFEILACGRPVILGAEGQARRIVEESGGGIAVTPEAADGYVEAILRLRRNPGEAELFARSGRAYVLAKHTRKQKAERYLAILSRMLETE